MTQHIESEEEIDFVYESIKEDLGFELDPENYTNRAECPNCGSHMIVWDKMEEANRCEECDWFG
ncbi:MULTISPECIES: hypothetical protein [unclassified Nostoc]|uniref:hypothetical protein n=1 Tax=unclassified Nostoc TaxID=2593658 RepID=UPI002AD4C79B|nr:hypothetical protein [Nostoc sp. DedQUE03]MDZ7973449.1 hypothetical protein [Nostoc sp. DedQUE03]MDZ8045065.1 hypothetical protein [Nostoc sp. DedQUE02]